MAGDACLAETAAEDLRLATPSTCLGRRCAQPSDWVAGSGTAHDFYSNSAAQRRQCSPSMRGCPSGPAAGTVSGRGSPARGSARRAKRAARGNWIPDRDNCAIRLCMFDCKSIGRLGSLTWANARSCVKMAVTNTPAGSHRCFSNCLERINIITAIGCIVHRIESRRATRPIEIAPSMNHDTLLT